MLGLSPDPSCISFGASRIARPLPVQFDNGYYLGTSATSIVFRFIVNDTLVSVFEKQHITAKPSGAGTSFELRAAGPTVSFTTRVRSPANSKAAAAADIVRSRRHLRDRTSLFFVGVKQTCGRTSKDGRELPAKIAGILMPVFSPCPPVRGGGWTWEAPPTRNTASTISFDEPGIHVVDGRQRPRAAASTRVGLPRHAAHHSSVMIIAGTICAIALLRHSARRHNILSCSTIKQRSIPATFVSRIHLETAWHHRNWCALLDRPLSKLHSSAPYALSPTG